MANNWFQFKQFRVNHHLSAMKVGTDSVLLGAWANGEGATAILDAGTGSGLLALMMAQRFNEAQIDAIDIVEDAVMQTRENASLSPWNNRIRVIHQSFQEYALTHADRYDMVICNPPYLSDSLQSPHQHRTTARHNHALPFTDLAQCVNKVLRPDGRFCVVIPIDQQNKMEQAMAEQSYFPAKRMTIYHNHNREPKRILIEFSQSTAPCINQELQIETDQRHHYTDDYKNLTQHFYLNF